MSRVKSGKFGRSAKFGQRPCLFHILIIGIKNELTKQTEKILMRRLIRSRLIWISTVCKCMSEFTRCPKLPDFTLVIVPLVEEHSSSQRVIIKWYKVVEAPNGHYLKLE